MSNACTRNCSHGPVTRGYSIAALAFFLLALLIPACLGADAVNLVPALGWDLKKQGGFPVSLAADKAGNVWVGTEGNGVWKYDAAKGGWTQFTIKDGLGDDCVYALATDHSGRIWAGHLNHGVSVYNGEKWRNYGLLDGPLGDRVFKIAVCPTDGDVWIGSDMGLARYSEKRQDWDYYSRASGLPSDQIASIRFDDKGRIRMSRRKATARRGRGPGRRRLQRSGRRTPSRSPRRPCRPAGKPREHIPIR